MNDFTSTNMQVIVLSHEAEVTCSPRPRDALKGGSRETAMNHSSEGWIACFSSLCYAKTRVSTTEEINLPLSETSTKQITPDPAYILIHPAIH